MARRTGKPLQIAVDSVPGTTEATQRPKGGGKVMPRKPCWKMNFQAKTICDFLHGIPGFTRAAVRDYLNLSFVEPVGAKPPPVAFSAWRYAREG